MTYSKPPVSATWLLERCSVRESVIGDLVERYQRRPSRIWYWRQVLFAIVTDTVAQVLEHKRLVVRGIGSGMTLLWLLGWVTNPLSIAFGKFVWNWSVETDVVWLRGWLQSGWPLSSLQTSLVWSLAGWVVARAHRPCSMAVVFALMTAHVLLYFSYNGWLYFLLSDNNRPPPSSFFTISTYWLTVQSVFLFIGGLLGANTGGTRSETSSGFRYAR